MSVKKVEAFINALNDIVSNKNQSFIELEGLGESREYFLRIDDLINQRTPIDQSTSSIDRKTTVALINFYKHFNDHNLNGFKQAYKRFQLSTLNSYFTPRDIIQAIIQPVFDHLKTQEKISILDPCAGTGNYIHVLKDYFPNADFTAVEKDFFTGQILKSNFQDVKTHVKGYEETDFTNSFDFIISNIPFGDLNVLDLKRESQYHLYKNRIHNYFFLKGLDDLKPGGIISFVTTSNFSDSRSNLEMRRYLLANSNLISAVRLPNNVFKNTGTSVNTDVLFLQKTKTPKKTLTRSEEQFLNSIPITVNDQPFYINEFFYNNQDKIIGQLDSYIFHNTNKLTVNADDLSIENISDKLREAISKDLQNKELAFPVNLIKNNPVLREEKPQEDSPETQGLQEGNLFIKNSKIFIYHKNLPPTLLRSKEIDRTSKIIFLRDLYISLFNADKNNEPNAPALREELNTSYDLFTFQYGLLNEKPNVDIVLTDTHSDLLLSLEKPFNKSYQKSDIFNGPLHQEKKESTANNLEDAILVSLNEYNKVHIEYISELLNQKPELVIKEGLEKQLLFIEPVFDSNLNYTLSNTLVDKSTFCSGYIEKKLAIFQKGLISGEYSNFINQDIAQKGINNLEQKVPYKLSIGEIDPEIGEPWINTQYFEKFAADFFQTNCTIIESRTGNDYKIKLGASNKTSSEYLVSKDRGYVRASEMLYYAMMDNIPEFTKTVIIDDVEYKQADQKTINEVTIRVEAIKAGFKDWLTNQKELIPILEHKYHMLNNAFVKKEIDGSYIKLPELVHYIPHAHQLDGAANVISNEGGILDHKVGYGKTLTMGIIVHKFVHTGISTKNLLIGLNANYVELYENIREAFPSMKCLLLTTDDFQEKFKQKAFLNIANNNWDLIVIPHSCIDRFPGEPEIEIQIIEEENQNIYNDLQAIKENDFTISKKERSALIKRQENNEIRLKTLYHTINSKSRTGFLTFNDLGITHILVDESHKFKNLAFTTRHSRVSGIGLPVGNKKTTKLLTLVRALQKKHGADKGVTFSSATPLSNSLTELYLIFKYLRPLKLKTLNISSFDQWARLYARKSVSYEQNVVGLIKTKERFRYFVKVPELAKLYNDIAHVADQRTFKLDVPELQTEFIEIQPYPELENYLENLKGFMETKDPSKLMADKSYNSDQMMAIGLIATNYGKKAAMDLRLVNEHLFDFHIQNKLNIAATQIFKVYEQTSPENGCQFVMCDMGTPNPKNFNVYDEMKRLLIQKGVFPDHIKFIHDAGSSMVKKEEIIDQFNNAEIRILFGSTEKLGTGVNAQKNAVAIHHLDIPWRPSDFDQRNGRAARQGNILAKEKFNNLVKNFVYGVKGTTDGYIFNSLAIKSGFIEQLKHATIALRTLDEGAIDASGNMSYADFTAIISNDSKFIEKVKLEKELASLEQKHFAFNKKLAQSKAAINHLKSELTKHQENLKRAEADFKTFQEFKFSDDSFSPSFIIELNKQEVPFEKFEPFGKALHLKLDEIFTTQAFSNPLALSKAGFKLIVRPVLTNQPIGLDNYKLLVESPSKLRYVHGYNILVKNNHQAGSYFKNALEKTKSLPNTLSEKIEDVQNRILAHENVLSQKSPYALKINEINQQIKKVIKEIEKQKNSKPEKTKPNRPVL